MLTERRSIEALRAGVPNRSAVRELGTEQKPIETRFLDSLSQVAAERGSGRQMAGFMVQGEFGTGKSHLLEWLQHVALEQAFACSKVVISKETPLGDPHKMFRAAIEGLTLPDRVGKLREVLERLPVDSAAYAGLRALVQDGGQGLDPLFEASLIVYERLHNDSEIVDRIVSFWSGDRIRASDLKKQLRQVGQPRPELRARRIQELAIPRFRFAAQLIAAAGYTGWVLLLDEVELMASLSVTARAKGYAVLAALAGRLVGNTIPGLYTVGTVTSEFTGVVFEQRRDHERIPQRWAERDPGLLAESEAGMAFLAPASRDWLRLRPQAPDALQRTHERVREIYNAAYGWQPPADGVNGARLSHSMRQHVRDWITRWDLLRLDPSYEPDIETKAVAPDLTERPDLEISDEPDEENGPIER